MRVRSSRFVGRERELGLLVQRLDDAREGRPGLVIVGGEAGVGKSRLIEEFGRAAAEQGAGWLLGAAADYGAGGLPFGPLVAALRPLIGGSRDAGLTNQLGPARHELARLFSGLAADPPPATEQASGGGPVADELSQVRLLDALLRLIDLVARKQPTVLVLEDLHWADASTRDFVAFLARNLGTSPLLVVVTYRSDDVGRTHPLRRYLAELERVGGVERIELARLRPEELRQLLAAIRGGEVDDAFLGELYRRSQGNAYFSEELLAAAARSGAPTALPDSLRDILLTRVEGLSADTRAVLMAAAVIGTADERLLGQVTGLRDTVVSRALREAIDEYVLEPAEATAGGAYAFRHALAREAIYDDLLAGDRARLHERVAQALSDGAEGERMPDAQRLAELAHHWRRAGQPKETFVASWRAGEAAERAHATAEASLHLEQVLALWQQLDDPQRLLREAGASGTVDRAAVALRAGTAAHFAADYGRAKALLRAAVDGVDAGAEPDRAADAYEALLWSLVLLNETDAAAETRDRLEALLPACSPVGRLRALDSLIGFAEHYGDLPHALELATRAETEAESTDDPLYSAVFRRRAGRSRAFFEGLAAGLADLSAARAAAVAAGSEYQVGQTDKDIGIVLQSAGRFEEAVAAFESSQRYLEPLGMRHITRHTDAEIGIALHRLGRWRDADAAFGRALTPPASDWGYVVHGYALVATGRLEEAEQQLRRAWPSVESSQASTSFGPYYTALAAKAIWEGRPGAAIEAAEQGLPLAGEHPRWLCELYGLAIRAAVDVGSAAGDQARQLLTRMRQRTRPFLTQVPIFGAEVRAWLATAAAEVMRADGPTAGAWAKAAAQWRSSDRPHELAYTLYRQAEAALATGDRESARELLVESWRLASDAGSRLLVTSIESLARRARLEVGAPSAVAAGSADSYGLTSREREVLALLARGYSDQRIADELFISPKTASVHVSNLKAKLGVGHRIEAATIGAGLDLAGDVLAPGGNRARE